MIQGLPVVSPSVSPRYPNPGPLELVRNGVCLIDAPGAPLFEQVRDGERLSVRGDHRPVR